MEQQADHDITIIGGFGHVGLPLAIAFADRRQRVCAFDIDEQAYEVIKAGTMPFQELGAEERLRAVLRDGQLTLSLDPTVIARTDTVIIVTGTPVDRHLNPGYESMRNMIDSYIDHFRDGQLIVLRSTVYPGTTDRVQDWLWARGRHVDVGYCPERIAEGLAMKELTALPQIVSSPTSTGVDRCRDLFSRLTDDLIVVSTVEAELTKLFNNVWRYIKFATANQFFMLADQHGADFARIHHAMTHNYPRGSDMAGAGFAAGPCLFKDTMQLAAFNNNAFYLGHAAMLINEGLPNYIINKLKQDHDLRTLTVGVLGMAFKADSDDPRESLSYKLRKILAFECGRVLCSDPYVQSDELVKPEYLIDESDIIILATPHTAYRDLDVSDAKKVVDVWNFFGGGSMV